jgi:hypothetical protein
MIYSGTQLILSFLWNEYLVWQELCFAVGATPFEDELNLAAIKNQILCTSSRSVEGKIKSDCIQPTYALSKATKLTAILSLLPTTRTPNLGELSSGTTVTTSF